MNRKKLLLILTLFVIIIFASCDDIDKTIKPYPTNNKTITVLSEGNFNQNNSTLAKYDIETGTLIKDYFREINLRGLGDVGNDMLQYGSKLYIVMNVSGTIEVVDTSSGKSIRQIQMKQEDKSSKLPRQIAAHEGKVYVTSYDDTVTRIDTVTLEQDASIEVGLDPDGIVISNNKIYVANSGGLNYLNNYNNTLSIIDIASFTVDKEIEVGVNPTNIGKDNRGNIYLTALGNYTDIESVFQKISSTGIVTTIEKITSPGRFVVFENKAYIIQGSYGNPYRVLVYDCLNDQIVTDNFVTDNTEIGIIHSIDIDEKTGDIFIMETDYVTPGTVYCFTKDGKLKYKIPAVGLIPTAIAFN
jgi:YVTN family beta-propeller protein